jgi:GNAT superfamily N-acetyltransferase
MRSRRSRPCEDSTAEIAFAVADDMHGRGVGTLLLEHLVSAACRQGVRTFTGPVLAENAEMLKVFADAGLSARRQMEDGVIEFACDLPQGARPGGVSASGARIRLTPAQPHDPFLRKLR